MEWELKQKCQSIVEKFFLFLSLFFYSKPHAHISIFTANWHIKQVSQLSLSFPNSSEREERGIRDNQYEWMVDGDLREEGRELEGNESRERVSEGRSLHSEGR